MNTIAAFIDQIAVGVYVLLAVACVWYIQKWSGARFEMRATTFELERGYQRELSGQYLASLVLLAEAAFFILGVQRVVLPQVREDEATRDAARALIVDSSVQDTFATPTFAVPDANPQIVDPVDPSSLGGGPVQDVVATPTNTPTLVGTIEPNAPEVIGCNTPNASLEVPANGMRVFEQIPVLGTAYVDNFSSYRIEIRGPGIPSFAVLDEGIIPVEEQGPLSQFNPATFERGAFQFRLVVFDTTTALRASCLVTIYITDPPLTPTPLPSLQPGVPPVFSTQPPTQESDA
jgi:hypothetical protein